MVKKFRRVMEEGDFLNSFFKSRLLEKNQNLIGVFTGPTGSGKSYTALSSISNYYENVLKKEYPVENIVFGIPELIKRLEYFKQNNMKGEILLAEEWGVNNSNLSFHDKAQKLFASVMQSFRSMNIGIIMTLPSFGSLAKNTRELTHIRFETCGIDARKKQAKVKPFLLETSQGTGKMYRHYPKPIINGRRVKIERLTYSLPPQDLINKYEVKKANFVSKTINELRDYFVQQQKETEKKKQTAEPTEKQEIAKRLLEEGLSRKEVADRLGITTQSLFAREQGMKKKGIIVRIPKKG